MEPQQSSRIDLGDLKTQIVKKLGADRSKWYFYHLNMLLNRSLSKNKFDKLCLHVLGKENLQLHNQFIRSILSNACRAKAPPPLHVSGQSKSAQASNTSPHREDDHELSGPGVSNQSIPVWFNGVLPVSPRKGKSAIHERKLKDRHSLLRPNGKVEYAKHQSVGVDGANIKIILNNGDTTLCDYQRPVQELEAAAELPESNMKRFGPQSVEKPRINSKFLTESTINEDLSKMERSNSLSFDRSPLLAPLGIPCCSASIGGARKAMPFHGRVDLISSYNKGELSDNETLRRRMDQIVTAQGLERVSGECPNVLNNMLDLYLKRMIGSCIELAGARSNYELKNHLTLKPHMQGKVMNGAWSSNDLNMSHRNKDISQEQRPWCSVSLLDLKIALELNPKLLGEDWPMMLEKICTLSFGE